MSEQPTKYDKNVATGKVVCTVINSCNDLIVYFQSYRGLALILKNSRNVEVRISQLAVSRVLYIRRLLNIHIKKYLAAAAKC